jgi:hypothetical protein
MKTKILFQTKKVSVVCFSDTLCDRTFPMQDFDSGGQTPYRKPNFMQDTQKKVSIC